MLFIKYGAFLLLTVASGYLSANMFHELAGTQLVSRILLVVVGLSLETVKVFALLRIEYLVSQGVKFFKGIGQGQFRTSILIYTALALLSLTASFGFILVTVDQQVQVSRVTFVGVTENIDFQIENLEDSLIFLTPQIESMQNQMAGLPADYITAAQRLNETITELQEERVNLISDITLLKTERSRVIRETNASAETNVYGMFFLLGDPFGLTETQVMYILLALASILIEAGMIFTSPTIKIADSHLHEVSTKTQRKKPGPKPGYKRPEKVSSAELDALMESMPPSKQENKSVEIQAPSDVVITLETPEVTATAKREPQTLKRQKVSDLLLIKQGSELKTPSEVAYVTGVSVDAVLKLYKRLTKSKGSRDGIPLIEEKAGKWKMNYDKSYIVSQLERSKK